MHLIIDGYNLLHVDRSFVQLTPLQLQGQRDRLIDQLADYKKLKTREITIVFDGWQAGWPTERREKKKGIEIIFSKVGEKADEVIKRLIKERGAGAAVITSDREIARYAGKMAVAVIPSDQFKDRIEGSSVSIGKDFGNEEVERGLRKKGPSRMLSKKQKRLRSALKKI